MPMYEVAYYNRGEVYKETYEFIGKRNSNATLYSINKATGDRKEYFDDELADFNTWNFFSIKNGLLKKYYKSPEICEIEGEEFTDKIDIRDIDVCPDIELVISYSKSGDEIEMFFHLGDEQNLRDIANYYSLPFPLKDDNTFDVDKRWSSTKIPPISNDINPKVTDMLLNCKLGSIKFSGNTPIILKVYHNVFS
jgi:hypothetical protein